MVVKEGVLANVFNFLADGIVAITEDLAQADSGRFRLNSGRLLLFGCLMSIEGLNNAEGRTHTSSFSSSFWRLHVSQIRTTLGL
jgi:hypothetical protein